MMVLIKKISTKQLNIKIVIHHLLKKILNQKVK
jgi:hypothetical protein